MGDSLLHCAKCRRPLPSPQTIIQRTIICSSCGYTNDLSEEPGRETGEGRRDSSGDEHPGLSAPALGVTDIDLSGKALMGGQFTVQRLIGRGGMGQVYVATDEILKRSVALKFTLKTDQSQNYVAQLQHEAQVLGQLNHPNIVKLYQAYPEVPEVPNSYFFSEQYVKAPQDWGRCELTLKQLLKGTGRLSAREALRLMERIFSAVEYLHGRNYIHRDLKPDNLLIDEENNPVLIDFGIARKISAQIPTRFGMRMGSHAYMAPEQFSDADSAGKAADIYSLGVILYELLTGSLPSSMRRTADGSIQYSIDNNNDAPSRIVKGLSKKIDSVIFKAISPNPKDRYQTVAEMREAVKHAMQPARKTRLLLLVLVLFIAVSWVGIPDKEGWRGMTGDWLHNIYLNMRSLPLVSRMWPVSDTDSDETERLAVPLVHQFVINNDVAALADLLHQEGVDVDEMNDKGETALYLAAAMQHVECARELLSNGANPIIQNLHGELPWDVAVESDNSELEELLGTASIFSATNRNDVTCAQHLINNNPALLKRQNDTGLTPLHFAASDSKYLMLLQKFVSVPEAKNIVTQNGQTALHYAADLNNVDAVKLLLESGWNPLIRDDEEQTAWDLAAARDNQGVLYLLGRAEVFVATAASDVNRLEQLLNKSPRLLAEKDMEGWTPLHIAAADSSKLSLLSKFVLVPDAKDIVSQNGQTALHRAAELNNVAAVNLLLESGWNPLTRDDEGQTPWDLAANRKNKDIMGLLGPSEIFAATAAVDVDRVAYLLNKSPQLLTEQDNDKWTPLHIACYKGYYDLVSVMLQYEFSANIVDDDGQTPLHKAVIADSINVSIEVQVQIVSDLLSMEVSGGRTGKLFTSKQKDKNGDNALDLAMKGDNQRLATLLESAGFVSTSPPAPVPTSQVASTPAPTTSSAPIPVDIFELVQKGELGKIEKLVQNDSSLIIKKDRRGRTILHHAAASNDMNICRWIREKSSGLILQEDNEGKFPSELAQSEELKEYLQKWSWDETQKRRP